MSESKYKAQIKYNKTLKRLPLDFKPEVLEAFRSACAKNGKKPTRVLKDYVNQYIKENS